MAEHALENKDKREVAMFMNFEKISKLIIKDLQNRGDYNSLLKRYKQEDVIKFLEKPERYEKELRDISMYLYAKSSHYKRLCLYFAKMPTFDYIIEPYSVDLEKINIKTFKNQYMKAVNLFEMMNIKHEFQKIMPTVLRDDIFYGYEHVVGDSYFIQKLHPNLCKVSSIEDGIYCFAFDFSFFDRYSHKLPNYPPEFQHKYSVYKKDSNLRWQELDPANTICIKMNEDLDFPIPPLAGVFEAVFDIEDYKALKKDREEIGNYKILIQKLPMKEDSDSVNDYLIDFDNMLIFHNKAAEVLPDQVGLITTPMDIKDIDFEKDRADTDNVASAEESLWRGAGVGGIFNSSKSGIGIDKSIKNDEAIIFSLLRQFERWLNSKARSFGIGNFRANLLDVTHSNKDEFFDRVIKAAQYGIGGAKMMSGASLGLSPSAMVGLAFLENEVLNLPEAFVPLSSSHTQDSNGDGGRPQKKSSELTDEGTKTRDKAVNSKSNKANRYTK